MSTPILYIATVLIWGSTWYAITFQLGAVALEWSVAYRFGLAGLSMFVFCLLTGRTLRFPLRQHGLFFGLGCLLFSSNYYFAYWSTEYLTSGLVAVAFSMISLFNILNGALFLRHAIEPRVIAAAFMGLGGLGFIFRPEIATISLGDESLLGLGICLIGTYLASLGNTVAASPAGQRQPLFAFNAWAMLYGALWMTALAITSGTPIAFDTAAPYVLSLLYLSLIGSVLAFSLFLTLMKRIGMGRAGYIGILLPVLALGISTLFEGYQWTTEAVLGLALVLGGNLVGRKRPSALPEADKGAAAPPDTQKI